MAFHVQTKMNVTNEHFDGQKTGRVVRLGHRSWHLARVGEIRCARVMSDF